MVSNSLFQIVDRYSIANRTDNRISIRCEDQVAIAIYCAQQIGKLWQNVLDICKASSWHTLTL